MPEIKNTFTQGKMNKDLDERIIPSGEYRDALNIEHQNRFCDALCRWICTYMYHM